MSNGLTFELVFCETQWPWPLLFSPSWLIQWSMGEGYYGLTTPNAAPIEIHVKCLNSMGRFNLFLTISTCSVAYHDKNWSVLFQKQVRYMFGSQTDFDLQSMSCIKVRTAQNLLLFLPSVTEQTHILLTHCTPARLSRNSCIWYPTWREQRVLIKYSQNYNLFVFVFNSTEVRTETLTIFCVMIPLLVDTWPDFGLFRVVRPYMKIYVFWDIFCWPRMKLWSVLSNVFFKLGR